MFIIDSNGLVLYSQWGGKKFTNTLIPICVKTKRLLHTVQQKATKEYNNYVTMYMLEELNM